jgi:hypothetical protein
VCRETIYIYIYIFIKKVNIKIPSVNFFKSSSPNKQGLNNTQEPTIFYPFLMSMYHRGKREKEERLVITEPLSSPVAIMFMPENQYDNHSFPICCHHVHA